MRVDLANTLTVEPLSLVKVTPVRSTSKASSSSLAASVRASVTLPLSILELLQPVNAPQALAQSKVAKKVALMFRYSWRGWRLADDPSASSAAGCPDLEQERPKCGVVVHSPWPGAPCARHSAALWPGTGTAGTGAGVRVPRRDGDCALPFR